MMPKTGITAWGTRALRGQQAEILNTLRKHLGPKARKVFSQLSKKGLTLAEQPTTEYMQDPSLFEAYGTFTTQPHKGRTIERAREDFLKEAKKVIGEVDPSLSVEEVHKQAKSLAQKKMGKYGRRFLKMEDPSHISTRPRQLYETGSEIGTQFHENIHRYRSGLPTNERVALDVDLVNTGISEHLRRQGFPTEWATSPNEQLSWLLQNIYEGKIDPRKGLAYAGENVITPHRIKEIGERLDIDLEGLYKSVKPGDLSIEELTQAFFTK
jgi:hypothetical protein